MDGILRLSDVRRKFGELRAVDGVTLDIGRGEIVGVIGPNGSGKTTLLNLASGHYRPDSGAITFNGGDIGTRRLHEVVHLGLVRSFQNPRIFGSLDSVRHTVAALRDATAGGRARDILARCGARWTDWADEARTELRTIFGGDIRPGPSSTLPYGQRRLLELARCLATRPSFLLLDEPTSGLNDKEATMLAALLARITREQGLTAMIVDHKFAFLRELCGRIVVMHQGRCIADGTPDEIANNAEVNEVYFGGSLVS